jgi:hypothetical protein
MPSSPHAHPPAQVHAAALEHVHDEHCAHTHAHDQSSASTGAPSGSPAAASSAASPPAGGHTHSAGSSTPCDYCSSIKAYASEKKATERAAARTKAERTGTPILAEHDNEEEDDDPLILPSQRVDAPVETWAVNTVLVVFGALVLAVVRNIILSRAGRQ